MTKSIYEIIETPTGGTVIKRTDVDGKEWWIPTDPANSDYQAYLNKDKPQVEHLTDVVQ